MEITVNVNINAPELSAAILSLASALSAAPVSAVLSTKPVKEMKSKSEFSFNLKESAQDAKPAGKPAKKPEPVQESESEPESQPEPEAESQSEPESAPTVTLEQVRAKLAALAQAGKQAQVKKLINDFGASKLTEIPAEKYPELLAAAEEIA